MNVLRRLIAFSQKCDTPVPRYRELYRCARRSMLSTISSFKIYKWLTTIYAIKVLYYIRTLKKLGGTKKNIKKIVDIVVKGGRCTVVF